MNTEHNTNTTNSSGAGVPQPQSEGELSCIAQGINVELLRKVAESIKAHPRSFKMESFFEDSWADVAPSIYEPSSNPLEILESECGTSACIAGWTLILTNNFAANDFIHDAAKMALGINDEQCRLLFYEGWPEPFDSEYDNARDEDNYALAAEVAALRVEHFIATGGAE